MSVLRSALASALLVVCVLAPLRAGAFELTRLDERPLRLDITASSVAAWNAPARDRSVKYDEWGSLINRINLQLGYWKLVGGLRLDTVTFANLPDPVGLEPPLQEGLRYRFKDDYRVGKAWVSYLSKELEVTAGDSYVSFGRGLVLSMRKQDELAVDTTLLGGKVIARAGGFSFTGVAGVANPLRLDEATGQSLLPIEPAPDVASGGRTAVYGRDALFGGRAEATWNQSSLALQGVYLDRAETLNQRSGIRGANTAQVLGGSLNVPVTQVGTVYLEGAWQHFAKPDSEQAQGFEGNGYAIYSAMSAGWGVLTGSVQLQHYRDFSPLYASTDRTKVPEFSALAYSSPPTTEPVTADNRLGYFDRCVTGGRARLDGRINPSLLLYGTYGRWATWGERTGECFDAAERLRNDVDDVGVGFELLFDDARSHFNGGAGLRHDAQAEDGRLFYREVRAEWSLAKSLGGPWSVALDGRHRTRYEADKNADDDWVAQPWNEGEVYLSLKYSPQLVLAAGYEYTGLRIKPPNYFNGTALWKYAPEASVRLFVGQQRGSIKCVSGTCREFPAFEGVKLEWVQRY